jgi:hypothetical protein
MESDNAERSWPVVALRVTRSFPSLSPTMNSTYPIIDSRPVHPHVQTTCSQCHNRLEFPVPSPAPKPATMLTIRCYSCRQTFSHAFYPNQVISGTLTTGGSSSQGQGPVPPPRKGRKIGTQERPLETGYYDLLGVPIDATTDDIKKAYRTSCYLFLDGGD